MPDRIKLDQLAVMVDALVAYASLLHELDAKYFSNELHDETWDRVWQGEEMVAKALGYESFDEVMQFVRAYHRKAK